MSLRCDACDDATAGHNLRKAHYDDDPEDKRESISVIGVRLTRHRPERDGAEQLVKTSGYK